MNGIKKANNKTYVVDYENGSVQPMVRVSFLDECYDSFSRNSNEPNRVRCEIVCSMNFNKLKNLLGDYIIPFDVIPLIKKWGINEDGEFSVVGYAKKSDLDTWDEVVGKHIAQTRAKAKAYEKASRIMKDIMIQIKSILACCDNSVMFYEYMKEDEDNHIEDLISNTYND